MTRITYAAYKDPEDAERALGELLESGISPEDLSLVAIGLGSVAMERRHALRMVDSGQIHLKEIRYGLPAVDAEGVAGLESAVGGGIATISADDDVSAPEELDDSQNLSENLAEPLQERWYGLDDEEDAIRFSDKGTIDSTLPTGRQFGDPDPPRPAVKPNGQLSVQVLGGLVILGDGPFATSLLATEIQRPGSMPVDAVMRCLYRQGVAPEAAINLSEVVESGGAVLAVTEAPGRLPLQELETLIDSSGAAWQQSFVLIQS